MRSTTAFKLQCVAIVTFSSYYYYYYYKMISYCRETAMQGTL